MATFYAMFSTEPRPPYVVHVCDDIACRVKGAKKMCDALEAEHGPPGSGADMTWVRSPCLGLCEHAPAVLVQTAGVTTQDRAFGSTSLVELGQVLSGSVPGSEFARPSDPHVSSAPQTWAEHERARLRLLRRVGAVDPASFDDYHAHGGYAALRRAVELGPEGTVAEITEAKLMGRGGAAFPTGVKWKAVAEQPVHPHYFICNADESEPGTFKDRVVMESDPYALVEALTIAGFATGAEQGYLYIRGEYPLATQRLAHAIDECRHRGYLGEDVMGEGFRFDIELRRGAGAYICGEETALFNSLEGKRGEPRNKPPFPVQRPVRQAHGHQQRRDADQRARDPADRRRGVRADRHGGLHRTAAVLSERQRRQSGPVRGRLRRDAPRGAGAGGRRHGGAEGDPAGRRGGRSSRPEDLDVRLTFEDARAGGYTLGSGVVMVFNQDVDLVDIVLRIAAFFRDESCGQCVPCRVGTVRQEEAPAAPGEGPDPGVTRRRALAARRHRAGHARRLDLRARPDRGRRRAVGHRRLGVFAPEDV